MAERCKCSQELVFPDVLLKMYVQKCYRNTFFVFKRNWTWRTNVTWPVHFYVALPNTQFVMVIEQLQEFIKTLSLKIHSHPGLQRPGTLSEMWLDLVVGSWTVNDSRFSAVDVKLEVRSARQSESQTASVLDVTNLCLCCGGPESPHCPLPLLPHTTQQRAVNWHLVLYG